MNFNCFVKKFNSRKYLSILFLSIFLISFAFSSTEKPLHLSKRVLYRYLSLTTILIKENYVDPHRINLDKMLISMLSALETRLSKLVIKLPKSLEEFAQKSKDKNSEMTKSTPVTTLAKETLILEMGNSKISLDYEPLTSIWGLIHYMRDVLDFVDEQITKQNLVEKSKGRSQPIDREELEFALINSMLETIDPHSYCFDPKRARDLTVTTKGEFGGIGIVISIRDGFLTVISAMDNTPASLAGVKAEDRIIQIEDTSAINMDLNDAVSMLRGESGSKVRISVERKNVSKPIEFVMKRAVIKVDSVAYSLISNEVGYLRIKAFQGQTGDDVKAGFLAMKKLSKNKINALILDVRDNPGGLLREAIAISDLFLDGGEIVSTKGSQESSKQIEVATKGQLDPNLKIILLTNAGSASASEIIAGALKYRDRAIVIGEKTFGKGSVQMLFELPKEETVKNTNFSEVLPPPTLKLTVAQYYAPEDKVIQTFGIEPDINITEVHASKINAISLFPTVSFREADLDEHLSADKIREEKSLFSLKYLINDDDEKKENYNNKLDPKTLIKDFYVKLASDILLQAKNASREALLEAAEKVAKKSSLDEEKKIVEALAKHKIDWNIGTEKNETKKISYQITDNKTVNGGETLKVSIKLKNLSEKPLYQVHGITKSKTGLFNQREYIFGKIDSNKEIERTLDFEIPKDVVSRKDYFTLEVRDETLNKIQDIDIPLDIVGLKRPRLAHTIFLNDNLALDENGDLKLNQDINLTVLVKNVGEGKSFEPTVLLKNDSGNKLFLKAGREQKKDLMPNDETFMNFSFKLTEKTDNADFEIQIFDGQIRDIWRDKVRFKIPPKTSKFIKTDEWVTPINKEIDLFSINDSQQEKIAVIKEKALINAFKQDDKNYLVKVNDHLVGLVKKTDVKIITKPANNYKNDKSLYSIIYNRYPPKVDLKFADNKGFSKNAKGLLVADISGPCNPIETIIYVNGKKVLYKPIEKYQNMTKISHEIELSKGVNNISVLVREDDYFGQLQNLTVFYDDIKETMFTKPKESPNSPVK